MKVDLKEIIEDGKGIITTPDGCKFVGKFKNDKAEGHGKLTFKNGDVLEGKWKDGERDIQVTYTWLSGEKYVGEYVNDSIDGQGKYTFPDGRKSVGEFKDGDPWNIKEYDKEGTLIGKIVNGVSQ